MVLVFFFFVLIINYYSYSAGAQVLAGISGYVLASISTFSLIIILPANTC